MVEMTRMENDKLEATNGFETVFLPLRMKILQCAPSFGQPPPEANWLQ